MEGQRQLKFNEAVKLLCDQQIGAGEAEALVWRAIESREIRRAWTKEAIVDQEMRAPRAVAAGFAVRFAVQKAAAHERAKSRLRLLTEVESVAFKDEIIAGNITLSEADLLNWLTRNRQPLTPQKSTAPRKKSRNKQARAQEAIKALYGDGVPAAWLLPNSLLCRRVSEWIKEDCKKRGLLPLEISDDTILRAAGRK